MLRHKALIGGTNLLGSLSIIKVSSVSGEMDLLALVIFLLCFLIHGRNGILEPTSVFDLSSIKWLAAWGHVTNPTLSELRLWSKSLPRNWRNYCDNCASTKPELKSKLNAAGAEPGFFLGRGQEPIRWSFHLPYKPFPSRFANRTVSWGGFARW